MTITIPRTLSTTDTSIATISGETVTGISVGVAHVVATHKVTGRQIEFTVGVYPGTFELRICASGMLDEDWSSAPGTTVGHCWIEIVSYSAFEQTIGHYQLSLFENVTIGRWGSVSSASGSVDSSASEFDGVWYNREKNNYVKKGAFSNYAYLSETIDKSTLNLLSQYIRSVYIGYNLAGNNCVHFATQCWNICVYWDKQVQPVIYIPGVLEEIIQASDASYWGRGFDIIGGVVYGYYNGSEYIRKVTANN